MPTAFIYKTSGSLKHIEDLPVSIFHHVIDRKDTAEDGIITPVEHISSVGAYLIIA